MIHIIPLSNSSSLWTVHQKGFSRELHYIIDFVIKLTINSIGSIKKESVRVNVYCSNGNKTKYTFDSYGSYIDTRNAVNKKLITESHNHSEQFLGNIYININNISQKAKNENKLFINYLCKTLVNATLRLSKRFDNINETNSDKLKEKEKKILEIIGIQEFEII